MSERYDISQHQGYRKGPWSLGVSKTLSFIYKIITAPLDGSKKKIVADGLHKETMLLITKTPEILDALGEAYELLDAAEETYESIGICLYCDACDAEHESHCKFASE